MNAQRKRLIADGIATGFIGYGIVVLFFVAVNLIAGRPPTYTAALLGEAVFQGLADPADVTMAAGPVIAFNGIHLVAYLVLGFFAAWLVYETELHPQFWYVALFMFIGATLLSYAAVIAIDAILGNPLTMGQIVAASLLAAFGMAAYLTVTHPSVRQAVERDVETPAGSIE